MDVVTHTLTGYLLSRAGLNRVCPHSTAILVLAANTPGLDLITMAGGDRLALEYHRGITHSLIGLPVIALVPLLLLLRHVRTHWRRAWIVSAVGVASHLLLDLATVYGVRLLSPFESSWFHLDLLPSTDIVLCGALLLATGWLALSRLVTREIGAGATAGRGTALLALAFVAVWTGARFMMHERALSTLNSRLYDSELPNRVAAFPHFANPLGWRGLVETGAAYYSFEMNLRESYFDPGRGQVFYKPSESAAIQAAEAAPAVRTLSEFARYPYWAVTPSDTDEAELRVQLVDLAFALPGQDQFTATALLDERGAVIESGFRY